MGWESDPVRELDPEGTGFDSGHDREWFFIAIFLFCLKNLGDVWDTFSDIFRTLFGHVWATFRYFRTCLGHFSDTFWIFSGHV